MCQPGRPGPKSLAHFDLVGLGGLGALPEHEVERVVLAVQHGHALAGVQLVQRLAAAACRSRGTCAPRSSRRRWSSGRPGPSAPACAIIDSICGTYSVARGSCVGRSMPSASASSCIASIMRSVSARIALAVLHRAADDLVVDVGDVAHVGRPRSPMALSQRCTTSKAIIERAWPEVAVVVDRHAAHVHAHPAGLQRGKILQFTRQRVVDAKTHEAREAPVRAHATRASDRDFFRGEDGCGNEGLDVSPSATIPRSINGRPGIFRVFSRPAFLPSLEAS